MTARIGTMLSCPKATRGRPMRLSESRSFHRKRKTDGTTIWQMRMVSVPTKTCITALVLKWYIVALTRTRAWWTTKMAHGHVSVHFGRMCSDRSHLPGVSERRSRGTEAASIGYVHRYHEHTPGHCEHDSGKGLWEETVHRLTEHFERLACGTQNSGMRKTVVAWTSRMSLTISVLRVRCVALPVVFRRCTNPSVQK